MMGRYSLTVPSSANSFDYNGDPYGGGAKLETDNPCEAIAFYNAARTTNPNLGRTEETPGFWQNVEAACTSQGGGPVADPPVQGDSGPGNENLSPGEEDSAVNQEAPDVPNTADAQYNDNLEPEKENNPPLDEEPTRPPEGEPHPTHSGEQPEQQTNAGDPIDLFSGSFYLQETDLTIPNTIIPLSFTRFYRSGAASFGPFGWNWDHNFNLFIRELATGDIALWRNLHEDIFTFEGADYEPPRGVFEKLERVADQVFEIKGSAGIVMHFERPLGWLDGERIPLLWLQDQHGNELHFSYGPEDKLAEVRDDDDRFFTFEYDACGLLLIVSDQAGRKFTYDHDEETMQLVCATSPAITNHPEGISRIYHYEQPWALPELRHNILRIEDAQGNVYLENTYDQDPASWSYARITEQLYGGFLFQFSYTQLQWVPANSVFINIPALRVEVMNPDYGLETYTFNYRGDLLDRRYRLSKDKSFRVVVWQYEFDEQGNLSKLTKPDGSEDINVFDAANADPRMRGNLLQKEITSASGFPSPSRIIWRGSYDPNTLRLKEERNETGTLITYRYDYDLTPAATTNSGKLREIIHPDATLPDGTVQQAKDTFEYNARGQLTATIEADGTRNEFEYGLAGDEKSRLVKQISDVDNLAIEHQLKYDSFGFNTETTDGNGNTTGQIFNALGLPEKSILPAIDGTVSEHVLHYDSDKKLILSERPKGAFLDPAVTENHIYDRFERDVMGYVTKQVVSENTDEARVLNICNDHRGYPVEIINPDGSKVETVFDERGLSLSEKIVGTDGKRITSKKVYDRSGKIIQETDPFGRTTKYEYDGFSRISKALLPNNTEVKNKWLKNDLLESRETIGDDGVGTIRQLAFVSYTYDEKSRRVTETVKVFTDDPTVSTNVVTTFFYDKRDRMYQIVNNRGGISSKQYDGLGRVTVETDYEENKEHFAYDNNGNVIQQGSYHKEPDGSTSIITKEFTYDARNRRIEFIEPDGSKIASEYDDRNLLVKQTDQLGIIKEISFNSFNNKTQEIYDTEGLNIVHRWESDNMSKVTSYTDPTGQTSHYTFDSVGRNYRIDYPNGFVSAKIFNDFNQVIREQLASGAEFEYDYDLANRITKVTNTAFPDPLRKVEEHTFDYDGLNRVLAAKTSGNEVVRAYDSVGRLLAETTLDNTISCTYDDVDGIVEKIWPDGRTEKLSHNLNGVLAEVEQTVSGILGSGNGQIVTFKTSGSNFIGTASFRGDITLENVFDDRKRLTDVTIQSAVGLNENIKYRYNKVGSKQVEALLGQNPKTSYFEFDHKYRLEQTSDGFIANVPAATTQPEHNTAISLIKTAASGATHTEQFEYNSADARTKYAETGRPNKNYSFLDGHQIQSDGTNIYAYHTDGTLESRGSLNYEVDALGRITAIRQGSDLLTEIAYDAFGRPSILKEQGKPDKSYNYLGGFVEQENEDGVPSRQITLQPGTGVPIAYHSVQGTHYTLFDSRFNLIGLVDTGGNLVETYRYKSFGSPQIFDNTGSIITASVVGAEPVFGGQQYLSESGLYLSKRRLMNPVDGIFLSADPMGYVDSSSLYVYAVQNPVDYVDPEGELAFLAALAIAAVAGAVIGVGFNAARQGIQIAEGSRKNFSFGELSASAKNGLVAGSVLFVAPEAAIVLAGMGITSGIDQFSQENYYTATFDVVTSVLPFASGRVRSATFGMTSIFGGGRSGNSGRAIHISTAESMDAIRAGNLAEGIAPGSLRSTPGAKGPKAILEGTGEGAWISPFEAARMSPWRRLMTGLPTRSRYVEFDVLPGELQRPGGFKFLYSRWQRQLPSPLDTNGSPTGWTNLSGRNPTYGELPPPSLNWPTFMQSSFVAERLTGENVQGHPNETISSK